MPRRKNDEHDEIHREACLNCEYKRCVNCFGNKEMRDSWNKRQEKKKLQKD